MLMKQSLKKKHLRKVIYSLLLIVGMVGILISSHSTAAEKRNVKVAFFPMQGYHFWDENGNYTGMDVEYLDVLCEYINWEIQYVPCDSWEEALQMLEEEQVDLVGSAQYSKERAEIFTYADLSSGYTYGVIATNADGEVAYEDFTAMKKFRFGMVENYVRSAEFYEYLAHNGIEEPNVVKYESTAKLQEALDNKEIDALVHTFTEIEEGQRLIGRFSPRPFYYISHKHNEELMRELNQAIADLEMNHPGLAAELTYKFYQSRLDKTVILTTEEKEYIASLDVLRIGFLAENYPFSYEQNGELKGLTKEMLEETLTALGMKLEYKKYKTQKEAENALLKGEIDLLSYCTELDEGEMNPQILLLDAYAEVPVALVMQKYKNFENIAWLAVTREFAKYAESVVSSKMVICDTQRECLAQLRSGQADAVLCDGYLVEYLLSSELQYSNLDIDNVLNSNYTVHLAVKRDSGQPLENILQKNYFELDARTINEYVLKESNHSFGSISQFINAYSLPIFGALIFIMALISAIAMHMIRDSRKIQQLMYKDAMLDTWNLNYFIYWGENNILSRKQKYAVLCFNLVQLRQYSIIYGWNKGEEILELLAKNLKQSIEESRELYARAQGDKFVALLEWDNWELLISRIRGIQKMIEADILEAADNKILTQVGVYRIPDNDYDLLRAVNYATQAVEAIADNNISTMRVYNASFEEEIKERHNREKLLDAVDIQKDFVAYYQSKVDIRTNKVVGAEALVRFLDPSAYGKVRTPWYFVPYYEKTGKIMELDFFVLEESCKLLRKRLDEGKQVVPISCNFTRLHFVKVGFAEKFEAILEKYHISKELIEVEITETLIMEEMQQLTIKETLSELKKREIRLSIDDFGSGYSSLGVFEQIPASVVKMDRSFFLNHEDRERQIKIMRGIVSMAETLDAKIVCEGVETAEDVALMEEIEAYVAQGYYFSKPIPREEFEKKLDAQEERTI